MHARHLRRRIVENSQAERPSPDCRLILGHLCFGALFKAGFQPAQLRGETFERFGSQYVAGGVGHQVEVGNEVRMGGKEVSGGLGKQVRGIECGLGDGTVTDTR